jgi:hypothetical protein
LAAAKTPEEQARLFKERKLPPVWDVEATMVRSNAAHGPSSVIKGGNAKALEGFLEREFGVKRREMSRDELKMVFGKDPFPF